MKKTIIYFILLLGYGLSAQNVQYTYDSYGNRTQRKLVINPINNNRMFVPDSTNTKPEADEGTMKLAMNYGVSVFPNPTQNNVNLSIYKIPENASTSVTLFDNTGKILQTFKNPKQQEIIFMENYKEGIYYISIIINDKDKLFYKVIKQ